MDDTNQQSEAIRNLLAVQDLLGGLGFTMTSDGNYYKDYALLDGGIARITPVFDRGISLDMAYRLVGFNLVNSTFIPASSGVYVSPDQMPYECRSDVSVIVNGIGSPERRPMVETHMINATCSMCGNEVQSFIRQGGQDTCIKCLGHTDGR